MVILVVVWSTTMTDWHRILAEPWMEFLRQPGFSNIINMHKKEPIKSGRHANEMMEKAALQEDEVDSLREKCQHLEKEAKHLEGARKRLESKVVVLQKQLCIEEQLVHQLKDRRVSELKTLRRDYMEKFETAMNLLKVRYVKSRTFSWTFIIYKWKKQTTNPHLFY